MLAQSPSEWSAFRTVEEICENQSVVCTPSQRRVGECVRRRPVLIPQLLEERKLVIDFGAQVEERVEIRHITEPRAVRRGVGTHLAHHRIQAGAVISRAAPGLRSRPEELLRSGRPSSPAKTPSPTSWATHSLSSFGSCRHRGRTLWRSMLDGLRLLAM
jgi:hypothetical protein